VGAKEGARGADSPVLEAPNPLPPLFTTAKYTYAYFLVLYKVEDKEADALAAAVERLAEAVERLAALPSAQSGRACGSR
jgi:hypothetical protein